MIEGRVGKEGDCDSSSPPPCTPGDDMRHLPETGINTYLAST